jgi:uncharacterized protein
VRSDQEGDGRGPTPSIRVSRLRELQVQDRTTLDALLDRARVAHVGFDVDGHPVVIPTAMVRLGDSVAVHGSTGSRWMRAVAEGIPACLAVTTLDGLLVARSAFESSLHYHSAVLFGSFLRLEGSAKDAALTALIDHLLPGRGAELRPSSPRELQRTMVLAMPIDRWSLKVSDGWPEDTADDVAGDAWAGVVPLTEVAQDPQPAPDLRPGIPVPPSVRRLAGHRRDGR